METGMVLTLADDELSTTGTKILRRVHVRASKCERTCRLSLRTWYLYRIYIYKIFMYMNSMNGAFMKIGIW